eukprot:s740_g10.t14
MVAEGNPYERIESVRAVSQKLRWMSDIRNGKHSSLSAGATEFVPAAPFAGRSTKAAALVTLSPAAAEFLPEGDVQHWGWNGSWSHESSWTGGSWTPSQSQSYPSANGGNVNSWTGVASSPTCWFNDDAYSTDSSRSDSEPEADEADDGAHGGPVEASGGACSPELHGLTAQADKELADDDEFDSFSEDDGTDASLPRTPADVNSDTEAGCAHAPDTVSEIPASSSRDDGGADLRAAGRTAHATPEELEKHYAGEEVQASANDISACKYDIGFMLAMRPATSSLSSLELPRCEQVGCTEDVPDFLRRREEAEENVEEKWRAARSGEAPRTRSRTAQDAKQTKSEKNAKQAGDLSQASAMKLEVSDSSWAAQMARRKALSKESSDDSFVKNMRSILNKLTVEKFDTLSDQIIEFVSQSDRPNRGIPLLMQLVFEKATTQHHFINMYVGLCVKLHKWLTENDHIDGAEPEAESGRKAWLTRAHTLGPEVLLRGFDGASGCLMVKYKTKMLGNIRLVGELIRHGMLAPKIAIAVASELARDDPAVRSERLETLATFLETVGVALDDPSWKHHHELELVFEQVTRACSDQTVPRRVRCLLQDVLDLRYGGWKSKRCGAKSISSNYHEVHNIQTESSDSRRQTVAGGKTSARKRRRRLPKFMRRQKQTKPLDGIPAKACPAEQRSRLLHLGASGILEDSRDFATHPFAPCSDSRRTTQSISAEAAQTCHALQP